MRTLIVEGADEIETDFPAAYGGCQEIERPLLTPGVWVGWSRTTIASLHGSSWHPRHDLTH